MPTQKTQATRTPKKAAQNETNERRNSPASRSGSKRNMDNTRARKER